MARCATFVVDRNCLFREGLKSILSNTRFRATGAGERFEELKPSVAGPVREILVIIGPSFTISSLLHEISAIRARHPQARVVVFADQYAADELAQASSAGTNALLSRSISPESLISSLELVLSGEMVISTEIFASLVTRMAHAPLAQLARAESITLLSSNTLVDGLAEAQAPSGSSVEPGSSAARDSMIPRLSARETAILECLIRGETNKVIARRFDVAEATVKVHVKAILRKIQVKNRTQAAIWAVDHGVQSVPGGTNRDTNGARTGA